MGTILKPYLGLFTNLTIGITATIIVGCLYCFAASSRPPKSDESGSPLHPLVITAGVFGRASLSNLQIFYFSLIVFWVLFYSVLKDGSLGKLSPDVLMLLGIGAAGTAGAKVIALRQNRLSFKNWAWLKKKGWIKRDIGKARQPPKWADLVETDEAFDIYKFQNIVVSLIVGIAILYKGLIDDSGLLEKFSIDASFLGLLGLSQAAYVGGKAVSPAPVADLNKQLDEVTKLEQEYIEAVAAKWLASAPQKRDDAEAKKAAPAEFKAYEKAARIAAVMVQERIGSRQPPKNLTPDIPD